MKSTNGSITACLASSRGVEYTDSTFPMGIPATYGTPFWLPHVTTESPFAGVTEWSTRSRSSRPRSPVTPRPRRKPISLLEPSRPPTTESVSRMSSTLAVLRVALITRPTRPSLFSTVMSLRTPEVVPASMVTVRENDCIGPMPTTRAATRAYPVWFAVPVRPSSSASRLRSSGACSTSERSLEFCAESSATSCLSSSLAAK